MSKIYFLPKDYQAPRSNGGYMKLQEGENKIRILSQPILGWEDWHERRPVRYRMDEKPSKSIDPKKPIKHFWSFIVWNYSEEQIQILHITQATIRDSIEALCNDEDWGAPFFYDIKIIKKGEGIDTEYLVNPLPHKPLAEYVKQAFIDKPCNLDALFDNSDPFSVEWDSYTPGVFDLDKIVTKEQTMEIMEILSHCDEDHKKSINTILQRLGIKSINELPKEMYDRLKNSCIHNRDSRLSKMEVALEA